MGPTLEKKKKSRMQIGVCLQSVSLYCRWPTLYRAGLKRRKVRPPPHRPLFLLYPRLSTCPHRDGCKSEGAKRNCRWTFRLLTRDGCIYTVSLAPAFSHALPATGDVPICQTRNFSERERNVDAASIPRDDWRDPDIVATSASSILSSSSSYSAGCACVRADVFQQSSGSSSSNPILGFLFLQAHFCCVDQSTIESTAGGGGGHVCATRTGEKILP